MDLKSFIMITGLVLLGVFVLTLSLLYTTTQEQDTTDNNNSESRIQKINSVLTSYFGRKWPSIFFVFAILLIFIAIVLYINSTKDWDIKISDTAGYNLTIIGLIILVLISITVILVFLNYFLKDPQDNTNTIKDRKKFLTNLGVTLSVIFILSFVYALLFSK